MRLASFLILLLSFGVAGAADVYRWVAPDGSIYYSDRPQAGAERITLPDWPPPQPRHYSLPPPEKAAESAEAMPYSELAIVKPERGETIRDNQGNVGVTVTLIPDLQSSENHQIQILLDGRARGEPSDSLDQIVTGVERGPHRVSAQVVDGRGEVLIRSPDVRFYFIVASPLFHPAQDTSDTGIQQAPRAPMAPRAPRAPHVPFRPAD